MLLTITNSKVPATDLGYLLHKNPGRVQSFELKSCCPATDSNSFLEPGSILAIRHNQNWRVAREIGRVEIESEWTAKDRETKT